MSRSRWFRDPGDEDRPPWRKRVLPQVTGWQLHLMLCADEPEIAAMVEPCRDIIQTGPPEPYTEPDWNSPEWRMMNGAAVWDRKARVEDLLADLEAFERESARYHKWYAEDWQRQIEAGSRFEYTPMRGMSILDDI